MKTLIYITIFFFLLPFESLAMEPPAIEVTKPYAFATAPAQKNGVVFFEIKNFGGEAGERLIKATSQIATKIELHTHAMDGGIMMMREVEAYELPVQEPVKLEPMGHHIMLMGLKQQLKPGDQFPLTLEFEKHLPIEIQVQIVKPGEMP